LRCEGQRLTWCEADPEGETFDVARLLHSGQPAGSILYAKHNKSWMLKIIVFKGCLQHAQKCGQKI